MNAYEVLGPLILGAFLGALGQGIRALASFKKVQDRGHEFDGSQLLGNLMVGAVAGVIAVIGGDMLAHGIDFGARQVLLTVIGAGYAGADFVEAFMRKNLPQGAPAKQPPPAGAQPGATGGTGPVGAAAGGVGGGGTG